MRVFIGELLLTFVDVFALFTFLQPLQSFPAYSSSSGFLSKDSWLQVLLVSLTCIVFARGLFAVSSEQEAAWQSVRGEPSPSYLVLYQSYLIILVLSFGTLTLTDVLAPYLVLAVSAGMTVYCWFSAPYLYLFHRIGALCIYAT